MVGHRPGGARDVDSCARTRAAAKRAKARNRAGIVGDAAATREHHGIDTRDRAGVGDCAAARERDPVAPEAAILPALLIVQVLTLLPPSTPSDEPLEVTVPLLVT